MHSPIPDKNTPSFVLTGVSFVCAPCIGLFFMVSGALLLPVASTMKAFYKKRLPKIIIPTLVWTIIYIFVGCIDGTASSEYLMKIVLSIPFSAQGHGVLWFMYVLVGLYLLSPIISPWLQNASRKEVEFVLLLWIVSLFYPLISNYLYVNESSTGILYYFSGYAGYYLLGFYLNKYQPKIGVMTSLIMILAPIIVCGLSISCNPGIDFYKSFWYLSFFVVSMALGWYCFIKELRIPGCIFISYASSLSFGIYLCHILVMRSFIWKWSWIDTLGWGSQIFAIAFITICISFFISYLVAFLPFGKYLIGHHISIRSQ